MRFETVYRAICSAALSTATWLGSVDKVFLNLPKAGNNELLIA